MKLQKTLRKPILWLIVAVLLVAGCVLLTSQLRGGRAGAAANAVSAVNAPIRSAATAIVGWFEDLYGYIYKYDTLVIENAQLKADLADAQAQVLEAAQTLEENERLKALLGFAETAPEYSYAPAKIVSWNASNWASSFTLNCGSQDGIELGDCVITEYGSLAGTIVELGSTYAVVRTVLDPGSQIGVLVGEHDITGIACGSYLFLEDGMLELTYPSDSTRLLAGDVVRTSGSGGSFPADLVIGTAAQLYTEAGGQITTASVVPACDFSELTQVFVITNFVPET